jgi:hypothetical protein
MWCGERKAETRNDEESYQPRRPPAAYLAQRWAAAERESNAPPRQATEQAEQGGKRA